MFYLSDCVCVCVCVQLLAAIPILQYVRVESLETSTVLTVVTTTACVCPVTCSTNRLRY